MKKLSFGVPEEHIPSRYCKGLNYIETEIKYDVSNFKFKETKRGCVLEFLLKEDEQIYGFGLQPFFVSTAGYGIYFDTARYMEAHCGFGKNKNRESNPNNTIIVSVDDLYRKCGLFEDTVMSVEIPVAKGIDIYIFEGDTILDVVSQYNMLAGGGPNVPEWGLGVIYRACGSMHL